MVQNVDRLTPYQMAYDYTGAPEQFYHRLESLTTSVLPHRNVKQRWKIKGKDGISYEALGTEIGTLNFYQMLIRMGNYKNILELGTYIGVSTLYLVEAAGWCGSVTTVEFGKEFADIAAENFKANGHEHCITQVNADAVEFLKQHAPGYKYDFILLDAAKEAYDEMFYPALNLLTDNGLLVVDDVFFQGESLNDAPTSAKGLGVMRLLEQVKILDGYEKVILPIGNGLLLVRKLRDNREPFYHAN